MSDTPVDSSSPCDSPPAAAMPARGASHDDEARNRLHQLVMELQRTHNRRLVVEYLRLRRAFR